MNESQTSCRHARWKAQVEGKLWRCKSCGILTAPEVQECGDPWCADRKFGSHPQHAESMSMERAAAYVAERDLARALTTEQTLRIRVAELEGRLRLSEEMADRLYAQIASEREAAEKAWDAACDYLASRNWEAMSREEYTAALLKAWNANPHRAAVFHD